MDNEVMNGVINSNKPNNLAEKHDVMFQDTNYVGNQCKKTNDIDLKMSHQKNNNKADTKRSLCKPSDHVVEICENPKEMPKKTNLITKIIRRLSKPGLFSKESKHKNSKENSKPNSARPSLPPDNKCNKIDNNVNNPATRSKSFRHLFHRFGKRKTKSTSAVNASTIVNCVGSCNDVTVDKLGREELEIHNASSVDCILDHIVGQLSNKHESASSNSEDLKDHEQKMNAPRNNVESIFSDINTSQGRDVVTKSDEDTLSPLNINLTLRSVSAYSDGSCRPTLSLRNNDNSSNVRLTLSLYGYGMSSFSQSRFNSKSCMEFCSASISAKPKLSAGNTHTLPKEINYLECTLHSNGVNTERDDNNLLEHSCNNKSTKVVTEEIEKVERICDKKEEEVLGGTDLELRRSGRPNDIQFRRSRLSSQTSIARSSLIMVAMSHNTPRNKSLGSHVTTPTYSVDSPTLSGKRLDFEEEVTVIEEEEKNGNYFLLVANQYEEGINAKIEVVKQYLESYEPEMNEEVIGELSTAIGLAKLLVSEKFVQFRGLCDQNLNESSSNTFKTLLCDLEGYLTTLEIQMADLDRNFQFVERIRENKWQMPPACPLAGPAVAKKKKVKSAATPADSKRSMDAKKRIAEFRRMSAANQQGASTLFLVQ